MTDRMEFPVSRLLLDRAGRSTPGRGHSARRYTPNAPLCIARGDGPLVWTVDGHELIDYQAGAGCNILGAHDPDVDAAIHYSVDHDMLGGIGTTHAEVELCELLTEHVPGMEQVLLTTSGSSATEAAIRVARHHTGADLIIKMEGNYHGGYTDVWVSCQTPLEHLGEPYPHSGGMVQAAWRNTMVARFGDLVHVEAMLKQHRGRVAALLIEPYGHNGPGMIPSHDYLIGLRRLCTAYGVVLIFDEVITGFRHALGGVAEISGVTPDLITVGKSLGGGEPIAAIGGAAWIMRHFDTHDGGRVPFNGTFNAHPRPVRAATAVIRTILRDRDGFYANLYALGDMMRDGLRDTVMQAGMAHRITISGYGSLFSILCAPTASPDGPSSYDEVAQNDDELLSRILVGMVERGSLVFPDRDGWRCCISAAHRPEHIATTIGHFSEALTDALAAA